MCESLEWFESGLGLRAMCCCVIWPCCCFEGADCAARPAYFLITGIAT